ILLSEPPNIFAVWCDRWQVDVFLTAHASSIESKEIAVQRLQAPAVEQQVCVAVYDLIPRWGKAGNCYSNERVTFQIEASAAVGCQVFLDACLVRELGGRT